MSFFPVIFYFSESWQNNIQNTRYVTGMFIEYCIAWQIVFFLYYYIFLIFLFILK